MQRLRTSYIFVLTLCLVPIWLGGDPTRAATISSDRGQNAAWQCGTYSWSIEEALAIHELNKRRLARGQRAVPDLALQAAHTDQAEASLSVRREGNVAVIDDDGTIVLGSNPFDYSRRGARFLRKGKNGYKAKKTGGAIAMPLGDKLSLRDDDSVRVDFPGFKIRYFGKTYSSLWVNSDGNLTFGSPDNASTARDMQRTLNGPPRISPLFADLNPEVAGTDGGVYARFAGNKLFVTWSNVPEFGKTGKNSFQVVVDSRGNVDFRFGEIVAKEGIVGVAPGGGSGLELIDLTEDLPIKRKGIAIAERFSEDEVLDGAAAASIFFDHFADDYDQVVMYTDFPVNLGAGGGGFTIAWHLTVNNSTGGIGIAKFNAARFWGSGGRLGGFNNMGYVDKYLDKLNKQQYGTDSPLDILLHEIGHQWLAFIRFTDSSGQIRDDLLGRQMAHWSFNMDTDASHLEGNDIQDNGDGTFITLPTRQSYSALDLYLMGMLPANKVPPFFFVDTGGGGSDLNPEYDVRLAGTRVDVTIEQITRAMGKRRPEAKDAPKDFKVGLMIVGRQDRKVRTKSIDKMKEIASELEKKFRDSTGNLGSIDTSLVPN